MPSKRMLKMVRKSEKQAASDIGGKTQPASGATDRAKGDAISDRYLVDDKLTAFLGCAKKSFVLTEALLDKVRQEALQHDREPVIRVGFINGWQCAIIDWHHFIELISRHQNESTGTGPSQKLPAQQPAKNAGSTAYPRPARIR